MRWISSPERLLADLADASLEAAWLTLAYMLAQQALGDGRLHLGLPALAVAALAGLLFARAADDLRLDRYTLAGSGLAVLVAAIGAVAFAPETASPDPWGALQANPGGLLAGVAFLRGTGHADEGAEAGAVERLLGIGLFGLAVFWPVFSLAGLATRPAFAEPALSASITFVTSALLALGLARLSALGTDGVSRPTRRRWLGVLLGVLGVALLVSLPLAAILGLPLEAAITGVLGPIAAVALGLLVLCTLPFGLLAGWLTEIFSRFSPLLGRLFPQQPLPTALPGVLPPRPSLPFDSDSLIGAVVLTITVIVVVTLLIVWMLGRMKVRIAPLLENEERATELPRPRLRLPRLAVPQRRRAPRTARDAYLAVLDLLSSSADASRRLAETPAEHARRLGTGDLSRLAADYQLDAFGRRILNQPEERRALDRWHRFKRRA